MGCAIIGTCDSHNEVKLFEGICGAQQDCEKEEGRTQGKGDAPKDSPVGCPVNGRGFVEVIGYGIETGKCDEHHKRRPHPDVDHQDGEEFQVGVGQPLRLEEAKDGQCLIDDAVMTVEDKVPVQAHYCGGKHHRHEENGGDDGFAPKGFF